MKNYAPNFADRRIPDELLALQDFEQNYSKDAYYTEGFELIDDDKYGLSTWSKHPSFLDRLIPFAQADGTGSFYAIWVNEAQNLNRSPIVVFGSEGGCHIVATQLLELLQLLSIDVEPLVDLDGVYYYRDEENYEPSPNVRKYKKWLVQQYQLSSIYNNFEAEQLVEKAQDRYQESFLDWMNQYL